MRADTRPILYFYNFISGDIDVLVPVYGNLIDEDACYVNLNSRFNKELLEDLVPEENAHFLFDPHNGRLITTGTGKCLLQRHWHTELKKKYRTWKDKHFKKYAVQCADYFARIKEFTNA